MPDITVSTARLIEANAPVLFLDTCILLDLVRSVERKDLAVVKAALRLAKAVGEAGCSLAVCDVVAKEWGDNLTTVIADGETHLRNLAERSSHFHDVCETLDIVPGFTRADYAAHGLVARCVELAEQLRCAASTVEPDRNCESRAVDRVVKKRPPAHNSQELKDCLILETCMAVTRSLRTASFSKRIVFCTSNTHDYHFGKELHPELATEFAEIDLNFTTNLNWGVHEALR